MESEIKNTLMPEGELTDWTKEELGETRGEAENNYISFEDLKKELEIYNRV